MYVCKGRTHAENTRTRTDYITVFMNECFVYCVCSGRKDYVLQLEKQLSVKAGMLEEARGFAIQVLLLDLGEEGFFFQFALVLTNGVRFSGGFNILPMSGSSLLFGLGLMVL